MTRTPLEYSVAKSLEERQAAHLLDRAISARRKHLALIPNERGQYDFKSNPTAELAAEPLHVRGPIEVPRVLARWAGIEGYQPTAHHAGVLTWKPTHRGKIVYQIAIEFYTAPEGELPNMVLDIERSPAL